MKSFSCTRQASSSCRTNEINLLHVEEEHILLAREKLLVLYKNEKVSALKESVPAVQTQDARLARQE